MQRAIKIGNSRTQYESSTLSERVASLAKRAFSLFLALSLSLIWTSSVLGQECGDADGNGVVNVFDLVFLMLYIFGEGPAPADPEMADFDEHQHLTIGDVNLLDGTFFGCEVYPECPPPNPPLEPPLSEDYRILYSDRWPGHRSSTSVLLTIVGPGSRNQPVHSMSLPLRIRVNGEIPSIDSVVVSPYVYSSLHSVYSDSGIVLMGLHYLSPGSPPMIHRFAKVYLSMPSQIDERLVTLEWVSMSPAQAPVQDSSVIPMVVGKCLAFVYEATLSGNCCVVAGDVDDDGIVNVSDVVYLLCWIFAGGPPPPCLNQGDADASGIANISDGVFLINYIFSSGPAPVCGLSEDVS